MVRLLIVMQLICFGLAARSWDIAVVTTEQMDALLLMGQVDFFSSNGSIQEGSVKQLADVQALEYDPIQEQLYVSDDAHKDYSIFTVNLRGNNQLNPLIKRTGNRMVRDIAYDVVSDTLYWTGENGIYWYNNSMENKEGEILIKLNDTDIPHGIALDRCRRYIYWTNRYHLNPSIERASLDGKNREVIVSKNLFRPMGIAVDEPAGKLYWSNDKEGIYYDIRRADLDGNNSEVVLENRHNDPVDLAIGPNEIYWTDNVHNAVWKISKQSHEKDQPHIVHKFVKRTPQGIVTWSDGNIVCHQENPTTTVKITPDFLSDEPNLASESSIKEMSNYCLNSGELVPGKISSFVCQCPIGYLGKRCEIDVCHNYCLNNGQCEVDRNNRPVCVCPQGASGSRCEMDVCNGYCLNEGLCNVDSEGKPVCICKGQYSGVRCEDMPDTERVCKLYCEQYGQMYIPVDGGVSPVCVCPTAGRGRYELLPTENSSYVVSAELKKSCALNKSLSDWVSIVLGAVCIVLTVATGALLRRVFVLKKRPRIKKRIIVNKNVTPLTSRPPQPPEQCEITIENCCNMNICETPCFEPQLRTPKSSQREEKKMLLGSMEEAPTSSPCQDDLY